MIKYQKTNRDLTLDEMIDCLRNPKGKRSLAELNDVIDEIIERNPDFVGKISQIIAKSQSNN